MSNDMRSQRGKNYHLMYARVSARGAAVATGRDRPIGSKFRFGGNGGLDGRGEWFSGFVSSVPAVEYVRNITEMSNRVM